jgi:hypothetical protein
MGKVSRCPFCKGVLKLPEGEIDELVVCPECREPIVPALLELELNPYAPPSFHPEASTAEGAAMPTEPTSVLWKYRHAFGLLFSNLGLFGALVLTVWLPANLLINSITYQAQDLANPFLTMKLNSFIEGLFGPIYVAGMIDALSKQARGQRATYPEAMAAGFRNWGRLFGTRFVTGLLILLGLAAFLVPGIVLMVRYTLVDPVVVLEGRSGSAARQRSAELVRGRAGQIVAAGFLFGLIAFSAGMGSMAILEALGPLNNMWTSAILDCCVDVILLIFSIVTFLIYWEAAYLTDDARDEASTAQVQ